MLNKKRSDVKFFISDLFYLSLVFIIFLSNVFLSNVRDFNSKLT